MKIREIEDYKEIIQNKELARLLGYAMVSPTPGKIQNAAQSLYSKQQGHFFAALDDEGVMVGIIGYKTIDNNQLIIMHVAVEEDRRGKGIGRYMVETVRTFLPFGMVQAEADQSQFRFFKALDFECKLAPESAYGSSVYHCVWKVPKGDKAKK